MAQILPLRDCSAQYLKPEWLNTLNATVFLSRCRGGEIDREIMHRFVRQHQWYAGRFTRYLAALLANIEDDGDRFELTRNLFDEMGLGDAGSQPHSLLYKEMMARMGIEPDSGPLPATQRLIDAMTECCANPNHLVGLGALCLGAEGVVPHIYSAIVDGFLAAGEPLENLRFFTLHIECDDDHADTMYRIIDKELAENPAAVADLHHGAERLIEARTAFFDSLIH